MRNAYDGPGFRTIDLSLVRQFGAGRQPRIEARVEAFNALNWFILRQPDGEPEQRDLRPHHAPTAVDPRVMQFAVKYQF